MAYRLTIDPATVRELKKLDPKIRQTVASAINALANDPRPDGVRKLSGSKDSYRIRAGDYRILYRIADHELLVLVVKVGHRRDVYR
ncbi:MAG: type II toxin-antitoxin system RelE/ParE family toxin [bacterium]